MTTRLRARLVVGAALILMATTLGPAGLDSFAGAEQAEGASAAIAADQRLISAGGLHTCAVLDTGEVQCWGANRNGQLGNETTALPTVPPKVHGITTAIEVSAGNSHTCALIHDGTVACWGHNGSGQLGDGTTSPPQAPVLAPVTVAGIDDATAISAGGFHTCAVRAGGTVACWGHDGSGQLGDGGATDASALPVTVLHDDDADATTDPVALNGATAVTAGEFHSCALLAASGDVWCWGHNGFGQLGNDTPLPNGIDSSIAVRVNGVPVADGHSPPGDDHGPHKALAITAGEGHTCAVIEGTPGNDDNSALCWGHNFYGQLGNNTTYTLPENQGGMDSSGPVEVAFDANADPANPPDIQRLEGIVSITAGQFHSCAGMADGSARCWGNNGRGQLGDDNPLENPPKNKPLATEVKNLVGVRAITAGGFHTCALAGGNALRCWGNNDFAQLGRYRSSSPTPVTVTGLSGARAVTMGDGHACALLEVTDADVPVCWGNNAHGELGAHIAPSPANSMLPLGVRGIADVGALGVDVVPPAVLPNFIEAGNEHACTLPASAGAPVCWGRNTDGELGNGTNTSSDQPVAVSDLATATQLSAGGQFFSVELGHSCARLADGSGWCWGKNNFGQLGDNTTTDRNAPVRVMSDHDDDHLNTPPPDLTAPVDLTGATYVAAGGRHACALMSNQTVRCWGRNVFGQLGDGANGDQPFAVTVDTDPDEPEPDDGDPHFSPLTGIVAITAGDNHSCAIKNDDTIWCWGLDGSGQLGDGTAGDSSNVPVQVGLDPAFFAPLGVAAGENHTCARLRFKLTNSTFAACWGDNSTGQLGNGGGADSAHPVVPTGLEPPGGDAAGTDLVKQVSAGGDSSCALLVETTARCWGDNAHGQLGDGFEASSESPVIVQHVASMGGNAIPVPQDDAATVVIPPPPGLPLGIDVLANDVDADGDPLTVSAVEDPARGTAANNGDDITYTPDDDFCTEDATSNTDQFLYWVTDGTAAPPGPWATVTVTVNCPNTAPDAVDDTSVTDEDSAVVIAVVANDTDINGDDITVAAIDTAPANGTAVVDGPANKTVTYTPNPDFFGTDTFTYKATDGAAESAPATVTVTVDPVNDGPVALDDSAATNEDTAVVIDVVANDTDIDGPSLGIKSVADAPHGSTSATSPTAVTYTPDADFCGADAFTYRVTDGELDDQATVTVTIACLNDGPNAVDDSATTQEDHPVVIDVLANDSDPEGDLLTVTAVTQPAHGAATINGAATITYTPHADFCGADSFAYTISDGDETDSALVVPVVVVCHNDPPVANDDSVGTDEDTATLVDVRANDVDVDGDPLTVVGAASPANGTAVITSSNLVRYTPAANFCGDDSFTYTVSDPSGLTDDATVSVTVTCVNDAPVTNAISDEVAPWGETVDIVLTASDPDAGDTVTYSLVTAPAGAVITGDTFTWTPAATEVGNHTITVRTTDTGGAFDDETFTVEVTRRATTLTYTGVASAQFSDPAGVSASLVDFEGAPVAGAAVSFRIGTRTAGASTDAAGSAVGQVLLGAPVGAQTVEVAFAGDAAYVATAASAAFFVEKERVTTRFAGSYVTATSGTSQAVQLVATVAEEDDGHLGSGLSTVQVTFREVGGGTLCTGSVSMTTLGGGTASCTTAGLPLGSRAVVVQATGAAYEGAVDVAAFTVAQMPSGSAAGAGRIDDSGTDDFAFDAVPVRKSPPAGGAVHVYRTGGTAIVVATDTLTSLSKSCTGGKTKVCTATVGATGAHRWSVDLTTGVEAALAGVSELTLQAADVAEPGAGADTYGATLAGADSRTAGPAVLLAGNVRVR